MASPVIVIERDLLKSKAYRTLPATAIVILFDFLSKRKIKKVKTPRGRKDVVILNNGEIEYCFETARKLGIPKNTFNRNRDILIDRGFIEVTRAGSGGKKGDKTLYALVDNWRNWGTDSFKVKTRPKDKRKGIGFQKMWDDKKNIGNENVTRTCNENVT